MFMVEIWVCCGPPYNFDKLLGTQFPNPGEDPASAIYFYRGN